MEYNMQTINIDLVQKASRLVLAEAFEPQTQMVDEHLCNGFFSYKDIKNFWDENTLESKVLTTEEKLDSIESWIPIRGILIPALINYGAPVLKNEHGCWWGRINVNTTIFRDPVIFEITKQIYNKVGG